MASWDKTRPDAHFTNVRLLTSGSANVISSLSLERTSTLRFLIRSVSQPWLDTALALQSATFLNLWRASGRREWARSAPGDVLLLTRAESPTDVIGFGLIHLRMLDYLSRVWSRFGRNNGADSLLAMAREIAKERPLADDQDPVIGNTILVNPVFMPPGKAFRLSRRFWRTAMSGGLDEEKAPSLLKELRLHAALRGALSEPHRPFNLDSAASPEPDTDGLATVIEAGSWSAYNHRCAVTAWKADVTLRVVYIRPLANGGRCQVSNTMLLRSELADLYIASLIAFAENGKLVMHVDLARQDPKAYRELARLSLRTPRNERDRPNLDDVTWRLSGPFMTRSS